MKNLTRYFHSLRKGAVLLVPFIVGLLLLAGITTPAFANVPITGTITAGGLTETTAAGGYSFTGAPGTTVTYPAPFTVNDFTGSGLGWKISITSTTLTGTAGTLPIGASTITGTTATCITSGSCSSDTIANGVTSTALVVPAGTTAPATGVVFFSAPASGSAGAYTVTPTISVVLPGGLLAGTISSDVTLTIASGP